MMTYTKEQLHSMTDLLLLRALYESLGFEVHEYEFQGVITIQKGSKVTTAELTPDDIMPLAFEHGISLISPESNGTEKWSAEKFVSSGFNNTTVYYDKNPLRAIVCCLILVLQKNEK